MTMRLKLKMCGNKNYHEIVIVWLVLWCIFMVEVKAQEVKEDPEVLRADIVAQYRTASRNNGDKIRRIFPEEEPLVCLAFLSCCGRTHLLKHSLQGLLHHMEHDEPPDLKYEIAWVDNGSGEELTSEISEEFPMEHVLLLKENKGLAFGMNALIHNLCTAPYILLLEEDWLYMDAAVAKQTKARKSAIARALAVTMAQPSIPSQNERTLVGVQLREKPIFMKQPVHTDVLTTALPGSTMNDKEVDIKYSIYCMDLPKTNSVFGSYTNGAGLYKRSDLIKVGRMYGELTDQFHDSYVETNYALRVGLRHCLGTVVLQSLKNESNESIETQAFAHIGGGYGTRPNKRVDVDFCLDDAWTFYGTPYYSQIKKQSSKNCVLPTMEEQFQMNIEYQKLNQKRNAPLIEKETQAKQQMLSDLALINKYIDQPDILRQMPMFAQFKTHQQILKYIEKMEKVAKSAHQLPGFWNNLGQPII